MKILMLGWEYPPHISGGLGTACEGLTTALGRLHQDMDFVVPKLFGEENAPHMRLLAPTAREIVSSVRERLQLSTEVRTVVTPGGSTPPERGVVEHQVAVALEAARGGAGSPAAKEKETLRGRIRQIDIPSYLSPYLKEIPAELKKKLEERAASRRRVQLQDLSQGSEEDVGTSLILGTLLETFERAGTVLPPSIQSLLVQSVHAASTSEHYGGDLFAEVGRYAARILAVVQNRDYDLIHAHDWMTYPAAIALKAVTGLPLVLHVHSLEYDRSGGGANSRIEEIEKVGLDAADTVIAVSYYTRELIHRRHGVPLDKIQVVHNGVYAKNVVSQYRSETKIDAKIVLFLGRVTFQKGPDYFVEAAARVVPLVPDVLFVMAGSGDMLPRMMERVSELGISDKFLFTGFLKGQDVEKMFSMADLYVMPSVSEPFGISALEAIAYNTPVIISRQSGVSEVLSHALKVNFWDIDQLANLIVSVLKYPQLSDDISAMATEEAKRLHWDAAAAKTVEIYEKTLQNFATQNRRDAPA